MVPEYAKLLVVILIMMVISDINFRFVRAQITPQCMKQLVKNKIVEDAVSMYRTDRMASLDGLDRLLEAQKKSVQKECNEVELSFDPMNVKTYELSLSFVESHTFRKIQTLFSGCPQQVIQTIIGKDALLFVEKKLQLITSKKDELVKRLILQCKTDISKTFSNFDHDLTKDERLEMIELLRVIPSQTPVQPWISPSHPKNPNMNGMFQCFGIIALIVVLNSILGGSTHKYGPTKTVSNIDDGLDRLEKNKLLDQLNQKETQLTQDIDKLNALLEEKKMESNQTREEMEKVLLEETRKRSAIESDYEYREEKSHKERQYLESKLMEKDQYCSQLSKKLDALNSNRQEIIKEKEELEQKEKQTKKELRLSQTVTSEFAKKLEEKNLELTQVKEQNRNLSNIISQNHVEFVNLRNQIEQLSQSIVTLTEENEEITAKLNGMKKANHTELSEVHILRSENERLRKDHEAIQKQLISMEDVDSYKIINELEQALSSWEKDCLLKRDGKFDSLEKILELKHIVSSKSVLSPRRRIAASRLTSPRKEKDDNQPSPIKQTHYPRITSPIIPFKL